MSVNFKVLLSEAEFAYLSAVPLNLLIHWMVLRHYISLYFSFTCLLV